ncbi:MAG: hypothetical protein C4522_19820 [Desulfobacteraceae bacterium]|nr:MAG: hypothetical protein C4522_19820 [Desulfobacteraceae bacterium]
MQRKDKNNRDGVLKSVFTAYFILVLHIFLIAALGILVLFFRGVVSYMLWIFLGGTAAIIFMGYMTRRRLKAEGKSLNDMLSLPMFKGKTVEVSVLGGLASLRIESPGKSKEIGTRVINDNNLLEDPEMIHIRELTTLVHMLDKNLITLDEYNKAKQKIFNS